MPSAGIVNCNDPPQSTAAASLTPEISSLTSVTVAALSGSGFLMVMSPLTAQLLSAEVLDTMIL